MDKLCALLLKVDHIHVHRSKWNYQCNKTLPGHGTHLAFTEMLDPHLENFLDPCMEPRDLKFQIWEDKRDCTV